MKIIDRDYELFLVMAKSLSLSRASDQIGIQQSGLSKALRRLELQLGKRLFIRKKSGLELTPYGSSLRDAVGSLRDYWEQHLREKISDESGIQGTLRMGTHASLGMSLVPPLLALMEKDYPAAEMEFRFARSPEVNRQVLNHELDLGIVANPVMFPDLVVRPLFKETVHYWVHRDFKVGRLAEKTVLFNPEMLNIDRLLHRIKPSRLVSVPNYEVLASSLAELPAVGILPELVAKRFPELSSVGRPFFFAQICLVYRKDRFISRTRRELIRRVSEALSKRALG